MKHIECCGERTLKDENRITLGPNTYEVDREWLKWPEELPAYTVLNATWASDGLFYAVTGKKEYPVVVFDKDGNYIKTIAAGEFTKTHAIFETKRHTFLITDSRSHVVKEIDPEGNCLRTWGTWNVPSDTGYDTEAWAKMEPLGLKPIETKWNHNPASNAKFQSVVRRGEPFNTPCAMIQAEDGEYFAADGYGNCAVHIFDKDGNLIKSWGEPGSEYGQFRVVHSVLLDKYNRLWVSDRENGRVQCFTRDGELLAVADGNLSRIGNCTADDKYLYIGELDGGITIIDLDTLECAGQAGALKTFMRTHGICMDTEGNLYTCSNNWNPTNITKFKKVN